MIKTWFSYIYIYFEFESLIHTKVKRYTKPSLWNIEISKLNNVIEIVIDIWGNSAWADSRIKNDPRKECSTLNPIQSTSNSE